MVRACRVLTVPVPHGMLCLFGKNPTGAALKAQLGGTRIDQVFKLVYRIQMLEENEEQS